MKRTIFVLSVCLALISCQKESISPTQAQVNATRLKSAINGGPVTYVFIEEGITTLYNSNISNNNYTISSDGFLVVGGISYSLEKLVFFQYSNSSLRLQY
ncbi:hypothetical protein WSM22_18080 [Cytophagales bacterium WSM2-2]|nr:hypothetical protein WSM22_18080 [Cytophagales bacterium WSM2-2]